MPLPAARCRRLHTAASWTRHSPCRSARSARCRAGISGISCTAPCPADPGILRPRGTSVSDGHRLRVDGGQSRTPSTRAAAPPASSSASSASSTSRAPAGRRRSRRRRSAARASRPLDFSSHRLNWPQASGTARIGLPVVLRASPSDSSPAQGLQRTEVDRRPARHRRLVRLPALAGPRPAVGPRAADAPCPGASSCRRR